MAVVEPNRIPPVYVDEILDRQPAIEIEIVFRVQNLASPADAAAVFGLTEATSPLIGNDRLERAGVTLEASASEAGAVPEHAVEVTFEGMYELAEDALADGASQQLDEHLSALGGWIAATLVKLADIR